MEYEVVATRGVPDQSEWRVEAIDYESEGECYVTIFSGPEAKERAEEYARFKNIMPRLPHSRSEARRVKAQEEGD